MPSKWMRPYPQVFGLKAYRLSKVSQGLIQGGWIGWLATPFALQTNVQNLGTRIVLRALLGEHAPRAAIADFGGSALRHCIQPPADVSIRLHKAEHTTASRTLSV